MLAAYKKNDVWILILICLYINIASISYADQLFKTAMTVNGLAITKYDIIQRKLFYDFIRKPENTRLRVENDLIDDRVKKIEIINEKIKFNNLALETFFNDYARRLKIDPNKLNLMLREQGIDKETVLDYLAIEYGWKEIISKKIVPKIEISDYEMDRILEYDGVTKGISLLLSEIALSNSSNKVKESKEIIKEIVSKPRTLESFSNIASRFSVSKTANNGVKLEWLPLTYLPKEVQLRVLTLKVGEISSPISMGKSLIIFQMRGKKTAKSHTTTNNIKKGSKEYLNVRARLFNDRAQSKAKAFLGKLRSKAIISYK